MENFEKRKNEWLESVSNDCHQFALKTNLDFYVFQTPIFYNPKLLIIGINPGGGKTYSEVLSEKNIDRRTSETLFYGENTLFEKPKWEIEGKLKGSDVLRDRLKRIFNEKNDLNILKTYVAGKCVFDGENVLFDVEETEFKNTFDVSKKESEDFEISCDEPSADVNVIRCFNNELITEAETFSLTACRP